MCYESERYCMQETAQNIVHNIIPFIEQPNWAAGQIHESAVWEQHLLNTKQQELRSRSGTPA